MSNRADSGEHAPRLPAQRVAIQPRRIDKLGKLFNCMGLTQKAAFAVESTIGYKWNVLDKLLFGTDFPVTTVQETIDHMRNINQIVEGTRLPRVSAEKIEEIIHRDSLALLGLS
jgi:hypothetical protein